MSFSLQCCSFALSSGVLKTACKEGRGKRMANQEHLDILKQGVDAWNQWKKANPTTKYDVSMTHLETGTETQVTIHARTEIDLSRLFLNEIDLNGIDLSDANLSVTNFEWANLSNANLKGADLRGTTFTQANLSGADLSGAYLHEADLSEANLNKAKLNEADLMGAILSGADLEGASLTQAYLMGATIMGANLRGANLQGADLTGANLSHTTLNRANLTGCRVHAVSAWDVRLDKKTNQTNLIITDYDEPTITVDDLEVAQFIYLLLNNSKIREVIDTIAKKAVLILGRFTPERKAILDAIRDELRKNNYLPILFDFDKPNSRDIHETVTTLARLARFVIADITNPKGIPQELVSIVETLPSLPIQPLLKGGSKPWGMFDHIKRYPWVLPVYRYIDEISLLQSLHEKVITPAEQKAQELAKR
jgi:uncharacterized protein YjbI with pentapeptide repeats